MALVTSSDALVTTCRLFAWCSDFPPVRVVRGRCKGLHIGRIRVSFKEKLFKHALEQNMIKTYAQKQDITGQAN